VRRDAIGGPGRAVGAVRFYAQWGDQVHQVRSLDDLEAVLVGGVAPHC